MGRIVTVIFMLLLLVYGVAVYDANKLYGSSWAVRLYFHSYEEELTDLADAIWADGNIDAAGYFVNRSAGVTFKSYEDYDEAYQEQKDAEFSPLIRAQYPNPFGVFCNGWYRKDWGVFCEGVRSYVPIFSNPMENGLPGYSLGYVPDGADNLTECKREQYKRGEGGLARFGSRTVGS